MAKLPKKPDIDRHRFLMRWDTTGFVLDARGLGVVLGIVAVGTVLCWLVTGVPVPFLPKKP